jgi:hypothetical protein
MRDEPLDAVYLRAAPGVGPRTALLACAAEMFGWTLGPDGHLHDDDPWPARERTTCRCGNDADGVWIRDGHELPVCERHGWDLLEKGETLSIGGELVQLDEHVHQWAVDCSRLAALWPKSPSSPVHAACRCGVAIATAAAWRWADEHAWQQWVDPIEIQRAFMDAAGG